MKKVVLDTKDSIALAVDDKALHILAMTQQYSKGASRSKKRLIRIRLNLLRELDALNKELRRHPVYPHTTGHLI